jgi:two-component system, OmpR family, sensor histidine kinase CreC
VKIRTRLALAFVVLIALGFYSLVVWIVDDLQPRYLAAMEETMIDTATLLAASLDQPTSDRAIDVSALRFAVGGAQRRMFSASVYELTKVRLNLRVYVTDVIGTVVFDSNGGRDEGKDYSPWNNIVKTLRGEYGARTTRVIPDDPASAVLHVSSPITVAGEIAGTVTVCKPVDSVTLFMNTAKQKTIVAGVVATLAVVLLGMIVSSWITWPIQKLTGYANAIGEGKRTPMPKLGRNEIGRLGAAFEAMRDTLEGKQYVEHYVQTLTHEMKSPLSAIVGAAELLDEDMEPERRAKFLKNIRTESARIQDLVDRLLQLSSLEKRKALCDVEDVDLAQLVPEVLDGFSPSLESKRIELCMAPSGRCLVRGETFLLRQAISNLMQNAVDFSPVDGKLSVSIVGGDDAVVMTIADEGPGVPEYALTRVFDRFYSLQRPDTGNRSSGLGLTFVREVAALHGGDVALENAAAGGVKVRFSLPTDPRRS